MRRTGAILTVLLGLAIAPATASAHPMLQLGVAWRDAAPPTAPVLPGSRLQFSGRFVNQMHANPATVVLRDVDGVLLGEGTVEESGWFELEAEIPAMTPAGPYTIAVSAFRADGTLETGYPLTSDPERGIPFEVRIGEPLSGVLTPVARPAEVAPETAPPAQTESAPPPAVEPPAVEPPATAGPVPAPPAAQPVAAPEAAPPVRTQEAPARRARRPVRSRYVPARPVRRAAEPAAVPAPAPVTTLPAVTTAEPAPLESGPRAVDRRAVPAAVPGPAIRTLESGRRTSPLTPPAPLSRPAADPGDGPPWTIAIALAALLGAGFALRRRRGTPPTPVALPAPAPAPSGDAMEAELQEIIAEERTRVALERELV